MSEAEGLSRTIHGPAAVGDYLSGTLPGVSVGIALVVLVSGTFFFRRTERSFADIV